MGILECFIDEAMKVKAISFDAIKGVLRLFVTNADPTGNAVSVYVFDNTTTEPNADNRAYRLVFKSLKGLEVHFVTGDTFTSNYDGNLWRHVDLPLGRNKFVVITTTMVLEPKSIPVTLRIDRDGKKFKITEINRAGF